MTSCWSILFQKRSSPEPAKLKHYKQKMFSRTNLECPQCKDQPHCITCSRLQDFAPILLWTCSSHTSLDLAHAFLERKVAASSNAQVCTYDSYETGETPLDNTDQACSNHVKLDSLRQTHSFCDCNRVMSSLQNCTSRFLT